MATEASVPVNGDYGAPSHTSSQSASLTNGGSEQTNAASPPKDEVGWYFVEQYYTTMSRSPDKVHLFYNKRSQFVYGVEAEKVPVSVGQRAINERISELGIEDCKVRVTNVDSQESGKSIVLQVIGEMSVKSQPHRKFAQTFVLAEQPNGYFVLNDIFRYIADEPEDDELDAEPEEEAEEAPAAAELQGEIKTLTSSDNLVEQAKNAEAVDKKLEQVAHEEESGEAAHSTGAAPSTVAETAAESAAEEVTEERVADPEIVKPELPRDPEPSPAATPAPAAAAAPAPVPAPVTKEPAAPPKPAAPKTWASITAANRAPIPIVPTVPIGQASQTQVKAAPVPAAGAATASTAAPASAAPAGAAPTPATAVTTTAATQAPLAESTEVPASPGGWQTAGQDHGKKQGRTQTAGNVNGYIKNVTANIESSVLRQALAQHGKVTYFDISRQKNCAFVEFETAAGFNAAVAANPHKVNGEDIILEERLPRTSTYGNNFRGAMRGNRNSMDGRTPSQGGRGGFKDNRGGFIPRGRGGAGGRGRGGAGREA